LHELILILISSQNFFQLTAASA